MSNLIRKSVISFGALAVAFLFVILAIILTVSGVTSADNGKPSENGRLITIHDRSVEKVIITQAATIGDALKEAGISVDDKDMVEPAVTQKLVASDYQVNVYRARPILVVDGSVRTKIITSFQTPAQIAQAAGIQLYDEDIAVLGLSDNIMSDGLGLRLTITRAVPFSFTLYGKTQTVRTHGKTVGEMLSEKGIKLEANDKVVPAAETPLTEGLAVRVWREGKQTVTVDEVIAFDVDRIEDADQMVSYSAIKTAGEPGSRSVSYEITVRDGIEVGRIEIASITTKQPKKQVEVVGVKGQYTTPTENENITWDYLRTAGFSRVQTAGIMGNLKQEHHFNTTGDGLVQWTDARRDGLYSKPHPNNIYTQLDYLMEELNGSRAWIRDKIKSTDSLTRVVQVFQNDFEVCDPVWCMTNARMKFASDILASH
ncbi:MAG: phage tail tip lysozyme [Candidatus Saccharibacteria bacterium]